MFSQHCAALAPGVGVTKPIAFIPLFFPYSIIVKTNISYWISCLYLAGVATAQLNANQEIQKVLLPDKKFCLQRN